MLKPKKSRPQLTRLLRKHFNEFIRLRDRNLPCISCGIRGVTEAGHYWSVGQFPKCSMRFNEKNVNGQCGHCNRFREGARQGYRTGLINKYGKGVIQELDVIRTLKQTPWRTFEFEMMIKRYKSLVEVQKMGLDDAI